MAYARERLRDGIAASVADSRMLTVQGTPARSPDGRVHVEFYDDADAVLDALLDHPDDLLALLKLEQVGWLDAKSGTFYKTEAPWRVPVYARNPE